MPKKTPKLVNESNLDIFLWANHADAQKDDLKIDLFVFTKGYTVYTANYSAELMSQMRSLFLYQMIHTVQMGAANGMAIRDLHTDTESDNVVDFTELQRVTHAQEVIEQIAFGEASLDAWDDSVDLRKVKGMVARFTTKGQDFYIVKLLQKSNMMNGSAAWEFGKNRLRPMQSDAAVQVTADDQVLVIGERIFVFNLSKFTRLFEYNAKKVALLDSKIAEIKGKFKLSYPEGIDMAYLASSNKQLTAKLLRCDPSSVTQDQLIEQADEFGLALMSDDNGCIIIMDARDATMFTNLLNDDYVDSNMTGVHYLAVKKKEVQAAESAQINMGI